MADVSDFWAVALIRLAYIPELGQETTPQRFQLPRPQYPELLLDRDPETAVGYPLELVEHDDLWVYAVAAIEPSWPLAINQPVFYKLARPEPDTPTWQLNEISLVTVDFRLLPEDTGTISWHGPAAEWKAMAA